MPSRYSKWFTRQGGRVNRKLRKHYCDFLCNRQPDPLAAQKHTIVTIFYDVEGNYAIPGLQAPCLAAVERILEIERDNGINTTYATVGKLALDEPDLFRAIQAEGNEIASHSYDHKILDTLPHNEKLDNVRRAKESFEEVGIHITGHRSPKSAWDMELTRFLCAEGYRWSAENGTEKYPYIISESSGNRLWRFPIRDDDYWYEGSGYSPAQVFDRLQGVVEDARHSRRYTAIGFHPWMENPAERMAVFSDFIQWLVSLDDVMVLPFGDVVKLMESDLSSNSGTAQG